MLLHWVMTYTLKSKAATINQRRQHLKSQSCHLFCIQKVATFTKLVFEALYFLRLASRCASRYNYLMIKSFKHKGLKKYFETGSISGIQAKHQRKLRMQLAAIDTAQKIDDVNLPGFKLHLLKGSRDGIWSITVNGNWRVTFEFIDGNAYILNYEDYH